MSWNVFSVKLWKRFYLIVSKQQQQAGVSVSEAVAVKHHLFCGKGGTKLT